MDQLDERIHLMKGRKVLVCPLNWGLGHASRCVPVIRALTDAGKKIIIAADGYPLAFLQEEFPSLPTINFPWTNVKYSTSDKLALKLLMQWPKFAVATIREHRTLKKIIRQYGIDTVISDNRFGLWNSHINCIYITHQLMIKLPIKLRRLEKIATHVHRRFIRRYNECWIPDFNEDKNLSGDLAHKYPAPENATYIGPLSRFSYNPYIEKKSPFEFLVLISGPEPQNFIFEKKIVDKLAKVGKPALILQGRPNLKNTATYPPNLTVKPHLSTEEMAFYLQTTPNIICRSGYSTIMDLFALKRSAMFIPTPGQTEQEYLGKLLKDKGFTVVAQNEL